MDKKVEEEMDPLQSLLSRSECLYSAEQIDQAVADITTEILNSLEGPASVNHQLLVLCVMNGAVPFTVALIQRLPISLQLDTFTLVVMVMICRVVNSNGKHSRNRK